MSLGVAPRLPRAPQGSTRLPSAPQGSPGPPVLSRSLSLSTSLSVPLSLSLSLSLSLPSLFYFGSPKCREALHCRILTRTPALGIRVYFLDA